jgi:type I site-specific restriction-modification system R (restriction) subunit
LLKYKKCCGEISTSGGKTLISFMIFKYLMDVQQIKNILYIVPSVDLATQSAEQYEIYESYLKKHNNPWEIGVLKAGLNKKEKEKVYSCNILFGTF